MGHSLTIQAGPAKIVATLMLPEMYWNLFHKAKDNLKNPQKFIEHLLSRYQSGQNQGFARPEKFTAHYQGRGLNLKKFNFSICPVIWHRFRCLARYYGVSMCWLLVAMLLDLKKIGTTKNHNTPFLLKLYEKVKITHRTALRVYKTEDILQWDTS